MIEGPALEDWAKAYAARVQSEAREKFPNDGHAQVQYALKSAGMAAVRAYRSDTGGHATDEAIWKAVDRWHILLSDPSLQEDVGPRATSPAVNLEYAGLLCRKSCGYSPGRCSWHADTATQCQETVPDSEFFCPTHTAEILASQDPYVHETWARFQAEMAAYRADVGSPPSWLVKHREDLRTLSKEAVDRIKGSTP